MGLVKAGAGPFRIRPVVFVGGANEARGLRRRSSKATRLVVPIFDVAGDVVVPLAAFGWGKPDQEALSAVPKRRHGVRPAPRGAKFDSQFHADIRLGVLGGGGVRQVEGHLAGSV